MHFYLQQEVNIKKIIKKAGMGVDSGLPDFRGNEGFWRAVNNKNN
jgi:NAD-dependent SIR2 family protein deacetylase